MSISVIAPDSEICAPLMRLASQCQLLVQMLAARVRLVTADAILLE